MMDALLSWVGTVGMLLFALALSYARSSLQRLNVYGRDALSFASIYLVSLVFWRSLLLIGIVTAEDARVVNGVTAVAFGAILWMRMWVVSRQVDLPRKPGNGEGVSARRGVSREELVAR